MKQVVVQAYCDLCAEEGQAEVPAEREETFNGYVLDLCGKHSASVEELLVILNGMFKRGVPAEEGKVPKKRGRPTGRPPDDLLNSEVGRTCPDCGYVTPTRSALGQHVKSKHRKVLGDYTWST